MFYQLREMPSFSEAVQILGGAERIDEALRTLTTAISNRPDAFDIVPPFKTLRIAKTDEIVIDGHHIPRLRLYFRIADAANVDLMWIEPIPDNDDDLAF